MKSKSPFVADKNFNSRLHDPDTLPVNLILNVVTRECNSDRGIPPSEYCDAARPPDLKVEVAKLQWRIAANEGKEVEVA